MDEEMKKRISKLYEKAKEEMTGEKSKEVDEMMKIMDKLVGGQLDDIITIFRGLDENTHTDEEKEFLKVLKSWTLLSAIMYDGNVDEAKDIVRRIDGTIDTFDRELNKV